MENNCIVMCPWCGTMLQISSGTLGSCAYQRRATGDVDSIINNWKTFATCGLSEENLEKLCGTKRDTLDFILNNY